MGQFVAALLLISAAAAQLPPPVEQPGALDVYPPTLEGKVPVAVDHFRFRLPVAQFGLRYLGYDAFASAGVRSPVFLYCGNEGSAEDFYNASGGIFEAAKTHGAFVVVVEHRYYGDSLPFGNASFTNDNLVFLTIEQALADLSETIRALPALLGCRGAHGNTRGFCDVVLWGGSYGGMLAAWHRAKYPHLSLGAVASGAPIDFYPGSGIQGAFLDAFVATFEDHAGDANGPGCGAALRSALTAASAASPADLEAAGVVACGGLTPPDGSNVAEQFAFYAAGAASSLAMVDYPYPCGFMSPLPANPVQAACAALLSGGNNGVDGGDGVAQVSRLLAVALQYVNASGDLPCLDLAAELVGHPKPAAQPAKRQGLRRLLSSAPTQPTGRSSTSSSTGVPAAAGSPLGSSDLGVVAWNYQACTQLPLEPLTSDGYGFYPPGGDGTGKDYFLGGGSLGDGGLGRGGGGLGGPGQTAEVARRCAEVFGVETRPFWMPLAFGRGPDYSDPVRGLSNVLFIENSKDPWHVGTATVSPKGGVGGSVVRFLSQGGAHHQDLRSASPYDSAGVHAARALERDHLAKWLSAPGAAGGAADVA